MSWNQLGHQTPTYYHSHVCVCFQQMSGPFTRADDCGIIVMGSDCLYSQLYQRSGFPHDLLFSMLSEDDWILEHMIVEWLGFCRDAQPLGSQQ